MKRRESIQKQKDLTNGYLFQRRKGKKRKKKLWRGRTYEGNNRNKIPNLKGINVYKPKAHKYES